MTDGSIPADIKELPVAAGLSRFLIIHMDPSSAPGEVLAAAGPSPSAGDKKTPLTPPKKLRTEFPAGTNRKDHIQAIFPGEGGFGTQQLQGFFFFFFL